MNDPLTDDELQALRTAIEVMKRDGHGGTTLVQKLAEIIKRHEPVKWSEPVPGVHVATCNGWSLIVRPHMDSWHWNACCVGRPVWGEFVKKLDDGKAAAVKYAKDNPQ
jgi:hypothetical protein